MTRRLPILAILIGLTCWLVSCQQAPQTTAGTAPPSTIDDCFSAIGRHSQPLRYRWRCNIHLYAHACGDTDHTYASRFT